MLLAVFFLCLGSQVMTTKLAWDIPATKLVLDWVVGAVPVLLLFYLSGNEIFSLFWGSLPLLLLSVADAVVIQFRGNELTPMDIASLRTALNVASGYHFQVTASFLVGILIWMLTFAFAFRYLRKRNTRKASSLEEEEILRKSTPVLLRKARGIVFFVFLILAYLGCRFTTVWTFNDFGARHNGFYVNFSALLLNFASNRKPEGYGPEQIGNMEKEYSGIVSETDGDKPDIILILDEALADLRILGNNLEPAEPVMPFMDSLEENTIRGFALSSVFGGNTSNSEYEVLTGNTLAFLPSGTNVYQLYLRQPTWSLIEDLRERGYFTEFTHPYYPTGWSRTRAYPLMGVDRMTFLPEYPRKNTLRGRVSDREMFEYVIKQYERRDKSRPWFLFGVTMQNHSPYDYAGDDVTPSVALKYAEELYPQAEQYEGLVKETDKALEYLVDYFRDKDRKTIIAVFGDHLPNLGWDYYEAAYGKEFEEIEDKALLYQVPFFVWANYDIEEKEVPLTSLNYLQNYIYQASGLPKPPYARFLENMEKEIPAVSNLGFFSPEQGRFLKLKESSGKEREAIDRYRILQYNSLFEKTENRSGVFFPTAMQQAGTPDKLWFTGMANTTPGLKITWYGTEGADTWDIRRREAGTGEWELLESGLKAQSYLDETAESGVKYEYQAAAFRDSGEVCETEPQAFTRLASAELQEPVSGRGGVVLSWPAVKGAAEYLVFCSEGRGEPDWQHLETVKASGNAEETCTVAAEESGAWYSYMVQPAAADGTKGGKPGGKTILYRKAVEVKKAENVSKGVRVTFTTVKGGYMYRLYRAERKDDGSYGDYRGVTELEKPFVDSPQDVWIFDETAEKGKTYRYSVRAVDKETFAPVSAAENEVEVTCGR